MGIIADLFCGAGGASSGIEAATKRKVDVAINHSEVAITQHTHNHPHARHYQTDVYDVSPREAAAGREVDLLWASPDCTHHSRAKGGVPIRDHQRRSRSLAWVVVNWALAVAPKQIYLENVTELLGWGPLIELSDGRFAPDPARKGETFAEFVDQLRVLGYEVEWRELCAADYGDPTIRRRLYLIARRDGRPIVWPAPTHAKNGAGGLLPWAGASTIVDWDIPCPSIFDRKRPLADNTLRRIAHGLVKYVIDSQQPFIVRSGHTSSGVGSKVKSVNDPLSTIVTKNSHMLVSAFLAKHYGGRKQQMAAPIVHPFPTVTTRGTQNQLVAASLLKYHSSSKSGRAITEPLATVNAQGQHHALISAFLTKFYGTATGQPVGEPLHTVTTKGRFGLVTCRVEGEDYVITDVGMRMLTPRELARAQGFPGDYQLVGTKTEQIAGIGNSVCPGVARALVAANHVEEQLCSI